MKLNGKFIVVLLFVLALSIRLYGIAEHSLFADEITWMVRGKEFFFAFKQLNLNYFTYGYWLDKSTTWPIALPMSLLSGMMLVFFSPGQSSKSLAVFSEIVAGRLPAVFIGSLFIPLFYLFLKRHTGQKLALVSSLLLVLDPVSLGLSRWVSQDLMLMVTSFLGLVLFITNKSSMSLILSAFFTAMAVLTKPQGGVVIISLLIYALATRKRELMRFSKWFLITSALTIIFFPFLWNNPFKILLYLKTQMEAVSLVQPPVNFLGQITTTPAWYYYLITMPFHLTETVLLGGVVGLIMILIIFKNGKLKLSPFLKVSLIYSILFLLVISWSNQKLGIRYAFPLWPYILLLSGFGLVKIADFFKPRWQKIYWLIIFIFPILAVVKFYPSYYLYHNLFISPSAYQKLESVGFCDGIKPAMEYLGLKLHEGIRLMFYDCNASANYYTGYTISHVYTVDDKPEYVVVETYSSQKEPEILKSLTQNGYRSIKEIDFNGLDLAKIYAP